MFFSCSPFIQRAERSILCVLYTCARCVLTVSSYSMYATMFQRIFLWLPADRALKHEIVESKHREFFFKDFPNKNYRYIVDGFEIVLKVVSSKLSSQRA
jgi:hypothetical protein